MLKLVFCFGMSYRRDLNFKLEMGIKLLLQKKDKIATPNTTNINGFITRHNDTPADLMLDSS